MIALTALNIVFLLLIGHSYLEPVPPGTSLSGWLAALSAYVSTAVMLCAAPAIIAVIPLLIRPGRWTLAFAAVLFFAVNAVIYADTVIYALYHCHFNGMILNLLTTPGAGDTLTLGRGTIISAIVALIFIGLVEGGCIWLATRERAVTAASKARWWLLAAALAAVIGDKAIYACGDLTNDVERLRVRQWFPFYQAVTMKRLAQKFGVQVAPRSQSFRQAGTTLQYPKAVQLPASPRRLNVVIAVIEGGRFDMLDPEVMPRLSQWSRNEIVCANHYSGGNCTRFGIFSLLYGLYGTYWHTMLSERRGPYLIHALKEMGYAIQVQSCTDLNTPEFRQTAFVDVPEAITDRWEGERVDRDRQMSDNAVAFMRSAKQPFFTFLFYDASHATYRYPPEHEIFTPVIGLNDVNYVDIARDVSAERLKPLFNRFRNSLHYVDEQVGKLLDQLQQGGQLDNTLVFVVGDHGEEFGDMGFHGHNVNFDKYQVQSLMVAHVPGQAASTVTRLTSHVDIVPTIMQAIGVDSPLAEYCQGVPLTAETARDHVVSASWDTAAIIDGEATVVVGTESYNPGVDIFDADYRPIPDAAAALKRRQPMMLDLLRKMAEFSR